MVFSMAYIAVGDGLRCLKTFSECSYSHGQTINSYRHQARKRVNSPFIGQRDGILLEQQPNFATFGSPRRKCVRVVAKLPLEPIVLPLESVIQDSPNILDGDLQRPKLRVVNLSRFAKNGDMILEGITMSAQPSSILALIGSSGSGKSTLLRSLNRLWEPQIGTVFLDDEDVTSLDVVKLRFRVGMVFQSPNLFEGTVASNVDYGPSLRKRHLTTSEIDKFLAIAGLDPANGFQSKPVNELSGGEAQRVAIARSLANEPEVLLLDEPTSSLDPTSTRKVEETILRLKEEVGLTVVLVSHSMEQVMRVADRAVLLQKGRVVEIGTPQELQQSRNPDVSLFFSGELD